ncbi:MAG TPA: cobalamin-independent methionine synthase II family protein [Chloroflexota bacterium]|nr:cobalamin-independent methionine synthase II family protein [Chloroflexota bacterium]
MKRSTDRILTTHCGSLPRPKDLLDLMKARASGAAPDEGAFEARVRSAVADVVRQQVENGVDVITDGEQGKTGFFAYVSERLGGFESEPGEPAAHFTAEVQAFPEYYEQYFRQAMLGGRVAPMAPLVCKGPITYQGQEAVQRDVDNLKAALGGVQPADVFMPAVAPSGVARNRNEYYRTDEEYLHAIAEAMNTEYRAIVDAGFVVQIDDPFITEVYSFSTSSPAERRKTAEMYVEAINYGLRGIPPEQVRFHTCYGINEGPRVHDAALKDIVDTLLKINAGAYSFEAANPRHEHEYHVWEAVKLPEGKVVIPGMITHAHNIVEHPELIAERLVQYAERVGRENVLAGADCGFSSQATYQPEVHPTVMWAKFRALAEGARLASARLWR